MCGGASPTRKTNRIAFVFSFVHEIFSTESCSAWFTRWRDVPARFPSSSCEIWISAAVGGPAGAITAGLTKSGPGTLALTNATAAQANNYTGVTTINGGTVTIDAANRLGASSGLVLNGGTINSTVNFSVTQPITLGLSAMVFGIVNIDRYGWTSWQVLVPFLLGVGLTALFVLIEARFAKAPLVRGRYRNIMGNEALAFGLMTAAERSGCPLFLA